LKYISKIKKMSDGIKSGMGPLYFLKNIVGAGGAAVITVSFIHPIDVVKTRL
jgi:hypothetical protein